MVVDRAGRADGGVVVLEQVLAGERSSGVDWACKRDCQFERGATCMPVRGAVIGRPSAAPAVASPRAQGLSRCDISGDVAPSFLCSRNSVVAARLRCTG